MISSLRRLRWIYYLSGLIVLLPALLIYWFFPWHFISLFTYCLGFLWNYAVDTPGVAERIRHRRYRISFLRFVTKFDQRLLLQAKKLRVPLYGVELLRSLVPFLLVLILYSLTYVLPPHWALAGSLSYVLWKLLVWKMIVKRFKQENKVI